MANKRLLRLADNPEGDDEESLESLLSEEPEDEDEDAAESLETQVSSLSKAVREQATLLLDITKSMSALVKHVMALDSDEDSEDEEEELLPPEDEDVELGESASESDFSPYGSTDLGSPESYSGSESDTKNVPGLVSMARKTKVSKDDASSNFGEKDGDVPGNPPITPDTKDWAADATIIPKSKMGPTLKKLFDDMGEIKGALVSAGIIKKAAAPTVGKTPATPEPDLGAMEDRVRNMSFQEINRFRAAVGDLPDSII